MQKQSIDVLRVRFKILNSRVAFVAFVANVAKCLIAWNVGVISEGLLATIIFLLLN